jgi:diguanylate cyclase (GGDEF)-like protein
VENLLAQAVRNDNACGVLYLDLDRYKAINDMIGHHAGDQVLIEVARRLRALLRQSDVLARMGGDEFTVCCPRVAATGDLVTIARKMIHEITQPIEFENQDLYIGASIGIAASQDGLTEAETLIRAADLAMYEAKRSGRGGYVVHSLMQSEKVAREVAVERALRRGLEEKRLTVAYQPIFDLREQRIHSLEVLARWTDSELGEVAPVEFISLAERTGLIGDVGAYVVQRACLDLQLIVESPILRDARISLNLSVHQLGNPAFLYEIRSLLEEMGIPADLVEFEVTEGVFEYGEEMLIDRLKVLKALGASISVDDFGTGYSSLARLRDYPIDAFKIDRAFVKGIETDPEARELCAAIVALGAALRVNVVAEGVETVGQLQALREAGCNLIQGYLLCRPVPRDELLALSLPELAH